MRKVGLMVVTAVLSVGLSRDLRAGARRHHLGLPDLPPPARAADTATTDTDRP